MMFFCMHCGRRLPPDGQCVCMKPARMKPETPVVTPAEPELPFFVPDAPETPFFASDLPEMPAFAPSEPELPVFAPAASEPAPAAIPTAAPAEHTGTVDTVKYAFAGFMTKIRNTAAHFGAQR